MSEAEELLDIQEAARFLRVSLTSLRRWTNAGTLPHLRVGGKRERRFRRSDLLAFLNAGPGDRAAPAGVGAVAGGSSAHRCGLFTTKAARVTQAARFLAEALEAGSSCLLLARPKASRAILTELALRLPSLESALRTNRLVSTEFAASGRAQLDYFESELAPRLKAGAKSLGVLVDLSGGGPERKGFDRLMDYERGYQEKITRRFPVVTLCLYDVRDLSGLETVAALQVHPDTCRSPEGLVLA